MRIAFRHTTAPLVLDIEKVFSETAENQMKFETIQCPEPKLLTDADSGKLLSGRRYKHILHKERRNEIIISSNELTNTAIQFLETIWTAPFVYVSYCKNTQWSNYVEIILPGGDFPLSFIDNLEYLPEITLQFNNAEAI